MKYFYDTRNTADVFRIIDERSLSGEVIDSSIDNAAVLVCLYYVNGIQDYLNRLSCLVGNIDIYIVSAVSRVIDICKEHYAGQDRVFFIDKENRGRDLSAFLVAGSHLFEDYDYLCFLHDKGPNSEELREDTVKWVDSLWDNMVGSLDYVRKIVSTFVEESDIGMMAPPRYMGRILPWFYSNTWTINYTRTLELAYKMGLRTDLSSDVPPVSVGTMFWIRTDALSKLIEMEWDYPDFPDEPLGDDNTISHALERIIEYVVRDSGCKVLSVMTPEYAEELIRYSQYAMTQLFDLYQLYSRKDRRISEMEADRETLSQIVEFGCRYRRVYIYGAGKVGQRLYNRYKFLLNIEGFVVTQSPEEETYIDSLPVRSVDEIPKDKNIGILLGVGVRLKPEVIKELESRGMKNYAELEG